MSANAYSECIGGSISATNSTVTTSKKAVTAIKPGRVGLLLHNPNSSGDIWYDFDNVDDNGTITQTAKAGLVAPGESVPLPLGDDVVLKVCSSTGSSLSYTVRQW